MSRRTSVFLFFGGLLAFCFSALEAIEVRGEARKLTAELYQIREEGLRLRDENRSLLLEYQTFTDYGVIRERAQKLGMREPSLQDGTLMAIKKDAEARQ